MRHQGSCFIEVKRPEGETDYLYPTSGESNNSRRPISTLYIQIHLVLHGINNLYLLSLPPIQFSLVSFKILGAWSRIPTTGTYDKHLSLADTSHVVQIMATCTFPTDSRQRWFTYQGNTRASTNICQINQPWNCITINQFVPCTVQNYWRICQVHQSWNGGLTDTDVFLTI